MKFVGPFISSVVFFACTYYVSYILVPHALWLVFLTSPFNISIENAPLYNLFIPAMIIFLVAFYLKNFNKVFAKKFSTRAVFLIILISNYLEGIVGYMRYRAVPLGTSVITISVIATFLIAICSYAENERVEHIYSKFLFSVIAALSAVAIFFVALTFLIGKSGLVHVIGISIFLPLFIAWYERKNLNVLFGMLMQ
jgi:hypothetical protein